MPKHSDKPKRQAANPPPDESDGKRRLTLYLPTAQARALKVYAAQNDQDMSAVVAEMLKKGGIG